MVETNIKFSKDQCEDKYVKYSNAILKHWPHRASASVLMQASMPENGDDADAWCGLYKYTLMWATTSVNVSWCGQDIRRD